MALVADWPKPIFGASVVGKTRFHSLLEAKINEEIERHKEDISTGIVNVSVYWRSVGVIEGLRGALRLCDDIERDLDT